MTGLDTYSFRVHFFNYFEVFQVVETGATNNGNLDIVLDSHFGFKKIRMEGRGKEERGKSNRSPNINRLEKLFQAPLSNENRHTCSLFSVKCHTKDVYNEDNH